MGIYQVLERRDCEGEKRWKCLGQGVKLGSGLGLGLDLYPKDHLSGRGTEGREDNEVMIPMIPCSMTVTLASYRA